MKIGVVLFFLVALTISALGQDKFPLFNIHAETYDDARINKDGYSAFTSKQSRQASSTIPNKTHTCPQCSDVDMDDKYLLTKMQ